MAKYDFYFVTYGVTYVKKYNDEIYYLSNEKKKEKTHIVVGGRQPGLRCVGQKWLWSVVLH